MGKIIQFKSEVSPPSNIIIEKPLQLRWADWEGGNPILVVNAEAKKFEIHRKEVLSKQHAHIAYVPNHITLKDGVEFTLRALLRYRESPEKMREVYYLAGLMECLMKVEQPVLRTVLVRTYYQTVLELKERLGVNWHGKSRYFLFPLFPMHYDLNAFFQQVCKAETLKELYASIREGVEEQFLILGSEYVFYIPRIKR